MLSDMNNGLHNKSFRCLTDIPAAGWAKAPVGALCSHQQPGGLIKAEVEDRRTANRQNRFFHEDDTLFCGYRDNNTGKGYAPC